MKNVFDDLMNNIEEYCDHNFSKLIVLGAVSDNGENKYIVTDRELVDDILSEKSETRLLQLIRFVNSDTVMQSFKNGNTVYRNMPEFKAGVGEAAKHICKKSNITENNMLLPIKVYTCKGKAVAYHSWNFNTFKPMITSEMPVIGDALLMILSNSILYSLITGYSKYKVYNMACEMGIFRGHTTSEEIQTKLNRLIKINTTHGNLDRVELVYKAKDGYKAKKTGYIMLDEMVAKYLDSIQAHDNQTQAGVMLTHELVYSDKGSLEKDKITGKPVASPMRVGFLGKYSNGADVIIIPRVHSMLELEQLNLINGSPYLTGVKHGFADDNRFAVIRLKRGVELPKIQIGVTDGRRWQLNPKWEHPDIIRFLQMKK